jgi:hypothetical protein
MSLFFLSSSLLRCFNKDLKLSFKESITKALQLFRIARWAQSSSFAIAWTLYIGLGGIGAEL